MGEPMKIFDKILIESKVLGNLAIGYHRTNDLYNVNSISKTGFASGKGAAYGTGIYLTYSLDSQLNYVMASTYGKYIIKAKVKLTDFVIFDENIAKIVYPKGWSIESQLNKIKLNNKNGEIHQIKNYLTNNPIYTSHAALFFYKNYILTNKINIGGLIFTGQTDGQVIVAYNAKSVIPIQYAVDSYVSKGEYKSNANLIKWNKIDPTNLVKRSVTELESKDNIFTKVTAWLKFKLLQNKWTKTSKNYNNKNLNLLSSKPILLENFTKENNLRFFKKINPNVNLVLDISLVSKSYVDFTLYLQYAQFLDKPLENKVLSIYDYYTLEKSKNAFNKFLEQNETLLIKQSSRIDKSINLGKKLSQSLFDYFYDFSIDYGYSEKISFINLQVNTNSYYFFIYIYVFAENYKIVISWTNIENVLRDDDQDLDKITLNYTSLPSIRKIIDDLIKAEFIQNSIKVIDYKKTFIKYIEGKLK